MKIVWEAEDIKPGQRVAFGKSTEQWIIGYDASIDNDRGESARYCLVSLEDGMVTLKGRTRAQLAERLTEAVYKPVEVLK